MPSIRRHNIGPLPSVEKEAPRFTNHRRKTFRWDDESVATLKRMWTNGVPASKIASEIDPGLSRNAVIGKAHRLGLTKRGNPVKRKP